MNDSKREQLEDAGYIVTDAAGFLGLSALEEALVETGLVLSNLVRETRTKQGLTQAQLAARLGTRQPNIARLETAAGTSFDKQFEALYEMGVSPRAIGEALATVEERLARLRAQREREVVQA